MVILKKRLRWFCACLCMLFCYGQLAQANVPENVDNNSVENDILSEKNWYCSVTPWATITDYQDWDVVAMTTHDNKRIPGGHENSAHRYRRNGVDSIVMFQPNGGESIVCSNSTTNNLYDRKIIIKKTTINKIGLTEKETEGWLDKLFVFFSFTGAEEPFFFAPNVLSAIVEDQKVDNHFKDYKEERDNDDNSKNSDKEKSKKRGDESNVPNNVNKLDMPFYVHDSRKRVEEEMTSKGVIYSVGDYLFENVKHNKENKTKKSKRVTLVPNNNNSLIEEVHLTDRTESDNLSIIQLFILLAGVPEAENLYQQILDVTQQSPVQLELLAESLQHLIARWPELSASEGVYTGALTLEQTLLILIWFEDRIWQLEKLRRQESQSVDLDNIRKNRGELIVAGLADRLNRVDQILRQQQEDTEEVHLLMDLLLGDMAFVSLERLVSEDLEELVEDNDEKNNKEEVKLNGLIDRLEEKIKKIEKRIIKKQEVMDDSYGFLLNVIQSRLQSLSIELNKTREKLSLIKSVSKIIGDREGVKEPLDANGQSPQKHSQKRSGSGEYSGSNRGRSKKRSESVNSRRESDRRRQSSGNGGQEDKKMDGMDGSGVLNKSNDYIKAWLAQWLALQSGHKEYFEFNAEILAAHIESFDKDGSISNNIIKDIREFIRKDYRNINVLLPNDQIDLKRHIITVFRIMRTGKLTEIISTYISLNDLYELKNKIFQGSQDSESVVERSNDWRSDWQLDFEHEDISLDDDLLRDKILKIIHRLPLFQFLEGEDRVIKFDNQSLNQLNESVRRDIGRLPVFVKYVSTNNQTISQSKEEVFTTYDSQRQLEALKSRFYSSSENSNASAGNEVEIISASRLGGVLDILDVHFKDRYDIIRLLCRLLHQDMGNTLRSIVFGGLGGGDVEFEGVLEMLGYPRHNPTNSNQSDPESQKFEIFVFSNGQFQIKYHLSYDQMMLSGWTEKFKGDFTIDINLIFQVSDQTITLKNSVIKYKGETKKQSKPNYKKAVKAIDKETKKQREKHTKDIEGFFNDTTSFEFFRDTISQGRAIVGNDALSCRGGSDVLSKFQEIIHSFQFVLNYIKNNRSVEDNHQLWNVIRKYQNYIVELSKCFLVDEKGSYESSKQYLIDKNKYSRQDLELINSHEDYIVIMRSAVDLMCVCLNQFQYSKDEASIKYLMDAAENTSYNIKKQIYQYHQVGGNLYKQRRQLNSDYKLDELVKLFKPGSTLGQIAITLADTIIIQGEEMLQKRKAEYSVSTIRHAKSSSDINHLKVNPDNLFQKKPPKRSTSLSSVLRVFTGANNDENLMKDESGYSSVATVKPISSKGKMIKATGFSYINAPIDRRKPSKTVSHLRHKSESDLGKHVIKQKREKQYLQKKMPISQEKQPVQSKSKSSSEFNTSIFGYGLRTQIMTRNKLNEDSETIAPIKYSSNRWNGNEAEELAELLIKNRDESGHYQELLLFVLLMHIEDQNMNVNRLAQLMIAWQKNMLGIKKSRYEMPLPFVFPHNIKGLEAVLNFFSTFGIDHLAELLEQRLGTRATRAFLGFFKTEQGKAFPLTKQTEV